MRIEIDDLDGNQAIYVIKFVDMLKASNKIRKYHARVGFEYVDSSEVMYPKTIDDCKKIKEIIDNNKLY